jgi:hypothetical protein
MADPGIIGVAGKVAGIGGLALGTFLILFRKMISEKFLPQMPKNKAYSFMRLVAVLIFIVTIVGIVAYVYINPQPIEPNTHSTPVDKKTLTLYINGNSDPEKHVRVSMGDMVRFEATWVYEAKPAWMGDVAPSMKLFWLLDGEVPASDATFLQRRIGYVPAFAPGQPDRLDPIERCVVESVGYGAHSVQLMMQMTACTPVTSSPITLYVKKDEEGQR